MIESLTEYCNWQIKHGSELQRLIDKNYFVVFKRMLLLFHGEMV